jgi:hypothetical protein
MTIRVWSASILAIALLMVGYFLALARSGGLPNLRSQHSRPAVRMPNTEVAVTAEGKTFHGLDCKFIHGPRKMMDAQTAAQQGYVPDPRCMHEALAK